MSDNHALAVERTLPKGLDGSTLLCVGLRLIQSEKVTRPSVGPEGTDLQNAAAGGWRLIQTGEITSELHSEHLGPVRRVVQRPVAQHMPLP
jgi:hypothetical protein